MARYTETQVRINGEWTHIKSGDVVVKDNEKYRFEWCTSQFERWDLLEEGKLSRPQNFEGGMGTADRKINTVLRVK